MRTRRNCIGVHLAPRRCKIKLKFKIPVSVLVVVHTPDLEVLLLERADHPATGSR